MRHMKGEFEADSTVYAKSLRLEKELTGSENVKESEYGSMAWSRELGCLSQLSL